MDIVRLEHSQLPGTRYAAAYSCRFIGRSKTAERGCAPFVARTDTSRLHLRYHRPRLQDRFAHDWPPEPQSTDENMQIDCTEAEGGKAQACFESNMRVKQSSSKFVQKRGGTSTGFGNRSVLPCPKSSLLQQSAPGQTCIEKIVAWQQSPACDVS